MSRPRKYTKELLKQIVPESYSFADVIRKTGGRISGSVYELVKARIVEYNIDISHFTGQGHLKGTPSPRRKSWKEILIYRSPDEYRMARCRAYRLRRALIEFGREYKCEGRGCIITDQWCGRAIRLVVDHINGDPRDCRPDNLRFLCPNCHSQSDNFGYSKGLTELTKCTEQRKISCGGCGKEIKRNKSGMCRECRSAKPS